jgi:protein TonB
MGRRAAGLLVALFMEALLLLLVLTLGSSIGSQEGKKAGIAIVRFKAVAEQQQEAAKPTEERKPKIVSTERSSTRKTMPDKVIEPLPKIPREDASPPLIRLSPREMATADIAALPKRPGPANAANLPKMGPVDTGPPVSDTPRVSGSGPNGEPLYAASWYREPYDDELRGYLSTASGPGWGLIACRTAPDYRVEDCVKVDEYPTGSNIARAVLAAAWQFRVRPPRIGGQPKIGEWVRIRIDYEFVPRPRR